MEPSDNKSLPEKRMRGSIIEGQDNLKMASAEIQLRASGEISISSPEHIVVKGDSGINAPTRKRVRRTGGTANDRIHKPFRSPIRTNEVSSHASSPNACDAKKSISTKNLHQIKKIESSDQSTRTSYMCSVMPEVLKDLTPLASTATSTQRLHPTKTSTRKPFRSPVHDKGVDTRYLGDRTSSRRIQIGALQSRILELKSSIRKAHQIIKQEEKNDTPLSELIEKWKKACQDGAQVLLEKYIEQEQFYGDNTTSSGYFSKEGLSDFSGFSDWGYASAVDSPLHNNKPSRLNGLSQNQIDAMEYCMESQDRLHDLPTVEEAIRLKVRPEINGPSPIAMTKMKKLLIGLGIDPAIIGYNEEQDSFNSEELSHEMG